VYLCVKQVIGFKNRQHPVHVEESTAKKQHIMCIMYGDLLRKGS